MRIGSSEHRALMCRSFIESHRGFVFDSIEWPRLRPTEQRFLSGLPIWDEAVNTEHETALLVRAMADQEEDPELAEAIAVQALEEERHSTVVTAICSHYGFSVTRRPPPAITEPVWTFRRSGWGECIDSFVAFGVFAIVEAAELVPKELLTIFDVVMQEEARHILFFENWRRYRRASSGNPSGWVADVSALTLDLAHRIRVGLSAPQPTRGRDQNFLLSGASVLEGVTPRSFVDLCLSESVRRLSPYDPDLRRPEVIPSIARVLRPLLPDRPLAQIGTGLHEVAIN